MVWLAATCLVLLLQQAQELLLVLIDVGQVEVLIQQIFGKLRRGLDVAHSQQAQAEQQPKGAHLEWRSQLQGLQVMHF